LTKSDGNEVGELINWEGMDESKISPIEGQIQSLLKEHGHHGLAAALRALWTELDEKDRVGDHKQL